MRTASRRFAIGCMSACALAALPFSSACGPRDRTDPGTAYFNDMAESEAYKYYSENPSFADGKTAQLPPPKSIPRGVRPYLYEKTIEDQQRAGLELTNPIPDTPEQLARAKALFRDYCVNCHGEGGKGDGPFVTSRKVRAKVTSLVDAYVQGKPDGEIFHVLTVGSVSGLMGAFSWQLKPDDRWRIVSYLKRELGRR
jgi:mono/diheme cytochrome c family protein